MRTNTVTQVKVKYVLCILGYSQPPLQVRGYPNWD